MFLKCLRVDGEERKVEDEKIQFKQAMWSKVNSWLTEIDNRGVSAAGEEQNRDQDR